uniref:Uncharacterized protein n=1 Tax=Arundo donax TaxID=35708 RepID=A0A0A9HGM6_ARUDO
MVMAIIGGKKHAWHILFQGYVLRPPVILLEFLLAYVIIVENLSEP